MGLPEGVESMGQLEVSLSATHLEVCVEGSAWVEQPLARDGAEQARRERAEEQFDEARDRVCAPVPCTEGAQVETLHRARQLLLVRDEARL